MKPPFKQCSLLIFFSAFALGGSCPVTHHSKNSTVKISFHNMVGKRTMALDTAVYTNPFNETYTITRFKYYISNVQLNGTGNPAIEKESYHLVDESDPESLSFSFETGENTFSGISFLLGVDSIKNVSGAQTGELDPLKDMFWTWNSGYVMAKMEGTSPQSTQVHNVVQYHIGGFSGANNVLKRISLSFPQAKTVVIKQGRTTEITLVADFNTWWQIPNDIKIAGLPVCTTPGTVAKKIADNYSKMFTVADVLDH